MIQRIQSIFLALVALLLIAFLFLPIWQKLNSEGLALADMNALHLQIYPSESSVTKKPTFILALLALVGSGVAVYSLLQYKKRVVQMGLGLVQSLLMMLLLGAMIYYILDAEKAIEPSIKGKYALGFFIPAICLVLNTLANRFIRRDEMMVKAADRLR